MTPAYLTPPEVADRLRVKPMTVLTWLRSGELAGVNVGRRGATRPRYRISVEALDAFLSSRAAASTTPAAPPRRRPAQTIARRYHD